MSNLQFNLIPAEYSEQRVLTTEQLAQVYERSVTQIKQNFSNNISRFEEGKHFFKLEDEELKKLRVENFDLQISSMTRSLYLWTKRGALKLILPPAEQEISMLTPTLIGKEIRKSARQVNKLFIEKDLKVEEGKEYRLTDICTVLLENSIH